VWEALSLSLEFICTSHTLSHLKDLGLGTQTAHKTCMPIVCSMHAPLKNPVALKVSVRSRGRHVILQILASSSFSLVESYGSLWQCVSFSLIVVGSGFIAYIVFLSFFLLLFLFSFLLKQLKLVNLLKHSCTKRKEDLNNDYKLTEQTWSNCAEFRPFH